MSSFGSDLVKGDIERKREFITQLGAFSFDLFKQSLVVQRSKAEYNGANVMISPLSVMLSLSMAANGAGGKTLAQMEKVLCGAVEICGDKRNFPGSFNNCLSAYAANLSSGGKTKLSIANSIWLQNSDVNIKEDFLQTNASYYSADIYSARFDESTVRDINNWVYDKTDGAIESMMAQIPKNTVMCLINAIAFHSEWEEGYNDNNVFPGEFNGSLGEQSITMMHSSERVYLYDDAAVGFVKPYSSGFSFAAMLPNEDVSVEDYIHSMNWSKFMHTINSSNNQKVEVTLPKFKAEYSSEMNNALKAIGIEYAFDPNKADFSKMSESDLYISQVFHKTFINVDERGTRAGASSSTMMERCAMVQTKYITLNRPFVYAIIENGTKLPIFIGMVMNVE